MKPITVVFLMPLFVFALAQTGCEQVQLGPEHSPAPASKTDGNSVSSFYTCYVPAKVEISPLTVFVSPAGGIGTSEINVYVSLLDSFGCQIKSPGVFRFELYEHIPRSSELKGRRIAIWPDTDLTDAPQNNKYWRDILRAYQFNLPCELTGNDNCIVHVTFLCPTGRRLSCEFILKWAKL